MPLEPRSATATHLVAIASRPAPPGPAARRSAPCWTSNWQKPPPHGRSKFLRQSRRDLQSAVPSPPSPGRLPGRGRSSNGDERRVPLWENRVWPGPARWPSASLTSSFSPCVTPIHSVRGRRAFGNAPAPPRVMSNGSNSAAVLETTRHTSAVSSSRTSPRNLRVKCMFCDSTHLTSAPAGRSSSTRLTAWATTAGASSTAMKVRIFLVICHWSLVTSITVGTIRSVPSPTDR